MSVFKKQDRKDERQPRQQTAATPTASIPQSDRPGKTSVVGKTLFVKGTVSSDEEVLILGKIEGTLNIKNRVVVGKSGLVNADIEAREVVVQGTVNGNVNGSYKVEVVPDGVLNGNIVSQRVVLAEGAIFKGNIDMTVK
jgi:cytoskeletal protein CcmA (bactofilin family)